MQTQQPTLSTYLTGIMTDRKISGYDLERKSGGKLPQSYVNRVKNGTIKNPSFEKIRLFASSLGVPPDEIFSVVTGKAGEKSATALNIASYVTELPDAVQHDLLEMVKVLHRKYAKKK